jgi:CDP-L-myo-inositol myo-inositolphosphotransferase
MKFDPLDALTPHSRRLTGPLRLGTVHPGRVRETTAQDEAAPPPAQALILFPDGATAGQLVAGVPAAARAIREVAIAGFSEIAVVTPKQWWPDSRVRAEVARLAGDATIRYQTVGKALADKSATVAIVSGPDLPGAEAVAATRDMTVPQARDPVSAARMLRRRSHEILRATAKPGDGIVSRYLNRPISQAISRLLLQRPGITPFHATLGTAVLAALMLASLIFGGTPGLIAGAVLFQSASIFDGVDGEIARATFRTSPAGARLDSLIDAATNAGFFGGVAFNLYLQGDLRSALLGAGGLVLFAVGLTIIARRSLHRAEGLTFNAVKEQVAQQPSRVMTLLTWLTMRDFFALAFAVLIAAGFAAFALTAFAVIVAGWFVVVVVVMRRKA